MIYIASKTIHAPKWRGLHAQGCPIISTWIYEDGPGECKDLCNLWRRCIREVQAADVLIAYREPNEVLKGALVEIGAQLASGGAVILVGFEEPNFSFKNHDLVASCKTMQDAFTMAALWFKSCRWGEYK
jgi:hypothetical protein